MAGTEPRQIQLLNALRTIHQLTLQADTLGLVERWRVMLEIRRIARRALEGQTPSA